MAAAIYSIRERLNGMRIGIIEDDGRIREELQILLNRYGYTCILFDVSEAILVQLKAEEVDMYLIDINLPVYDGFYLCREIRKSKDQPIVFLTSRDTDMDELMGIQAGADDFITKPFNTQILLARIESIMNRYNKKDSKECILFGKIELDLSRAKVCNEDSEIELTVNEMKILHYLMQFGGKIVTRDVLMTHLWSADHFVDDNTLTVNINRLRSKLTDIGLKDVIITKRGQGYVLNEMV